MNDDTRPHSIRSTFGHRILNLGAMALMTALLRPAIADDGDQEPLWLSGKGMQPPRLYLFWQSGWKPRVRPEHVKLVSVNRPDLFPYVKSSGLNTGIPHESLCPAPGAHRTRWSYEREKPDAKPVKVAAGPRPSG